MYFRFSKLARFAILFSFALTLAAMAYHGVNLRRMVETNRLIFAEMERTGSSREIAIDSLEKQGVTLYIGGEFSALTGIVLGPLALFLLYQYSRGNSFFYAMAASFFCLLTSFVGGLLLFYVIFSGKSERAVKPGEREYRSQWEKYISEKAKKA